MDKSVATKNFVQKLTTFIRKNKQLVHIDLTGMFLEDLLFEIVQNGIKKSCSLLGAHLSNNHIPTETMLEINGLLNILVCDMPDKT